VVDIVIASDAYTWYLYLYSSTVLKYLYSYKLYLNIQFLLPCGHIPTNLCSLT